MGDPDRLACSVGTDQVEFEIPESVLVGREDQGIAPLGMEKGSPGHRSHFRELPFVPNRRYVHRENLGGETFAIETPPADFFPVRAEERPTVITDHVSEALHVFPVGIGNVNFHGEFFVELECLLVGLAHRSIVGLAVRCEDDLFSIGRISALRVVAFCRSEFAVSLGLQVVFEEFKFSVVIPGILAGFAGISEIKLGFLFFLRLGIALGGGVDDFFTVGMNPGAGCFSVARRDSFHVAGFQIHEVDLVERIILLAFALENHFGSVRGEITFPGAFSLEGELASCGEE